MRWQVRWRHADVGWLPWWLDLRLSWNSDPNASSHLHSTWGQEQADSVGTMKHLSSNHLPFCLLPGPRRISNMASRFPIFKENRKTVRMHLLIFYLFSFFSGLQNENLHFLLLPLIRISAFHQDALQKRKSKWAELFLRLWNTLQLNKAWPGPGWSLVMSRLPRGCKWIQLGTAFQMAPARFPFIIFIWLCADSHPELHLMP